MLGLSTIDVLIGLAVLFLLLSLTCSACMELLATWFRWRAANFAQAISGLLQNDQASIQAFFEHRIIWTMSPDSQAAGPVRSWIAKRLGQGESLFQGDGVPSYVSAQTFADVLGDLIVPTDAPAAQRGTYWTIRSVVLDGPGQIGSADKTRLNLSKNVCLADVLRSFVNSALRAADDATPDADARRLAAFNDALATWYDQTMDRASGWYKRKVKKWIFAIGLIAAAAFNIDTLSVTQALYSNPALRQQAAALGERLSQPTASTQPSTVSAADAAQSVDDLRQFAAAGLPFGWMHGSVQASAPSITLKLFGILVTAIAVSLGAPFWFDVLGKLVDLRAAGAKPPLGAGGSSQNADDAAAGLSGAAPNQLIAASAAIVPPGGNAISVAVAQVGLAADYWSQETRHADFLKFNPQATTYSAVAGACLARAALLAYQNEDIVKRIALTCWGAAACEFVDIDDTQAFVMDGGSFVLVAFRGTEPSHLQDILADARYALLPSSLNIASAAGARSLAFAAGRAHSGFLRALACAIDPIDGHVSRFMSTPSPAGTPKTLWVTGHSLGAALATLYSARVQYATGNDKLADVPGVQGLYTFGSPRVGDAAFVAAVAAPLAGVAFRFINHEDIVTRVAPRAMGYDHLGHIMYLDQNGVLDQSDSGWVRFLNSVVDVMNDYKIAAQSTVKDHSMELYMRKMENLVPA